MHHSNNKITSQNKTAQKKGDKKSHKSFMSESFHPPRIDRKKIPGEVRNKNSKKDVVIEITLTSDDEKVSNKSEFSSQKRKLKESDQELPESRESKMTPFFTKTNQNETLTYENERIFIDKRFKNDETQTLRKNDCKFLKIEHANLTQEDSKFPHSGRSSTVKFHDDAVNSSLKKEIDDNSVNKIINKTTSDGRSIHDEVFGNILNIRMLSSSSSDNTHTDPKKNKEKETVAKKNRDDPIKLPKVYYKQHSDGNLSKTLEKLSIIPASPLSKCSPSFEYPKNVPNSLSAINSRVDEARKLKVSGSEVTKAISLDTGPSAEMKSEEAKQQEAFKSDFTKTLNADSTRDEKLQMKKTNATHLKAIDSMENELVIPLVQKVLERIIQDPVLQVLSAEKKKNKVGPLPRPASDISLNHHQKLPSIRDRSAPNAKYFSEEDSTTDLSSSSEEDQKSEDSQLSHSKDERKNSKADNPSKRSLDEYIDFNMKTTIHNNFLTEVSHGVNKNNFNENKQLVAEDIEEDSKQIEIHKNVKDQNSNQGVDQNIEIQIDAPFSIDDNDNIQLEEATLVTNVNPILKNKMTCEEFMLNRQFSNEEDELSVDILNFVLRENLDFSLHDRYLEFIRTNKSDDDEKRGMKGLTVSRPSSKVLVKHKPKGDLVNCPSFCSCPEKNFVKRAKESWNAPPSPTSCVNNYGAIKAPSNQSRVKLARTKSMQIGDPKSYLTIQQTSNPQVTVAGSPLTNELLQNTKGDRELNVPRKKVLNQFDSSTKKGIPVKKKLTKINSVKKTSPVKSILKKTNYLKRTPPNVNLSTRARLPAIQEASTNRKSKVLNAHGLKSNRLSTNSSVPISRNNSIFLRRKVKKMPFSFLNPFRRSRPRNFRGRVPIAVKPNAIKPKKGYEYEDLLSQRTNNSYTEKRRNSAGKIYIRDPKDQNNILIAEEIGYVYGDIRKNVVNVPEKPNVPKVRVMKVDQASQTVALDESKIKKGNKKEKQKNNYARPRIPPYKQKPIQKWRPITFTEDLQTAAKRQTQIEKGDYIIISSKNLPKIKGKNVSFIEAERGSKSISSTLMNNTKDRLYGNQRDAATGYQAPDNYQSNGTIIANGVKHDALSLKKKPLERRASFDGPLPPVRNRNIDNVAGEFFSEIHHTSSQPNLSQISSNPLLPSQEDFPSSPLRSFDDPEILLPNNFTANPKKKTGWGRVKELTKLNRNDTSIDMSYGSSTDLLMGGGGQRKYPGSNVPIVMLQGLFNAGALSNNRRRPSKILNQTTLPKNLLEPNSILRGALPLLPSKWAGLCLTFNIFIPGLGTLLSGWLGLCIGRNRMTAVEKQSNRYTALVVTSLTGIIQLFTVSFFFVGWFWSISWGIILVSISRRYTRFMSKHRSSITQAVGLEMLTVNAD